MKEIFAGMAVGLAILYAVVVLAVLIGEWLS